MTKINLLKGNNLETLKKLADNSVDSIVTDPPYGLNFMGKKWDYDVPSIELWKECFRVLKHGGHLLSFGGTRTYHRLVVNIEDAGFEIRDCIQWLYGSGFPKSTNVALRIDKEAGAIGDRGAGFNASGQDRQLNSHKELRSDHPDYVPPEFKTESAKQWQGWGTALKPANEPICVARKPLEKGLTVADNVLKHGTGAMNIDASRIETSDKIASTVNQNIRGHMIGSGNNERERDTVYNQHSQDRWPANIILDEVAAELLDEQSGNSRSGVRPPTGKPKYTGSTTENSNAMSASSTLDTTLREHSDSGGASRFFYVAKASKAERNRGLEGMPTKDTYSEDRPTPMRDKREQVKVQNHHPTVKPIKLMSYLIKLVTPPNGTVLDPFMGSGSTGVAAKELGFSFVGCELSPEYFEIAEKRIDEKG